MANVRMTQVTALIIQAVGAGYRYGFDIMDITGLASGTVYPALRRLEGADLLKGTWEEVEAAHRGGRPQRRMYELTEEGEVALTAATDKLAAAKALLLSTPRAKGAGG